MLMATTVFQGVGTFFVALERTFGWNRTTLSGAFSLSRAEGALLGPFEGFLTDRFGTRRMVVIGYLIMGGGFIWYSYIQEIWHFYAAYLAISLGSGIGGWLPMVALINNWFRRRRALAMSVAVTGIQFGGFLVPIMAWGIENHGFRVVTLWIGVILIVVALPASRYIRNRPEDQGLLPDGERAMPAQAAPAAESRPDAQGNPSNDEPATPAPESADDSEDMTLRQALRTVSFWVIAICRLTSVVSIVSLAVHLVPKLTDGGMSLVAANFIVLLYTAAAMPAGLVAGYLADRTSNVLVLFVCMLLQAVAVAIIAVSDSLPMALLFALLWGVGFGGRVPLLTAIIGEFFGRKNFGTILGVNMIPSNIAMIFAPLFAGYMFDATQSYLIPFAALGLVGAFLILLARTPSRGR